MANLTADALRDQMADAVMAVLAKNNISFDRDTLMDMLPEADSLLENRLPAALAAVGEVVDLEAPPLCTVTWFISGGRDERQCDYPAENICASCGEGRCSEEHADGDHALTYYRRLADGFVFCEECIGDDTPREEIS